MKQKTISMQRSKSTLSCKACYSLFLWVTNSSWWHPNQIQNDVNFSWSHWLSGLDVDSWSLFLDSSPGCMVTVGTKGGKTSTHNTSCILTIHMWYNEYHVHGFWYCGDAERAVEYFWNKVRAPKIIQLTRILACSGESMSPCLQTSWSFSKITFPR